MKLWVAVATTNLCSIRAIPRFRTYTSDSSVLYLVINLSIYIIVKVMFQYSLVLFTSIPIANFVIFFRLEEKLVKYVGFRRTQRMVILQTCMISHKISVMCGVEWKYFLYIFEEKTYASEFNT